MKKKKLIPKRRFKEFINDDAWEQCKLGDIGSTYTGLSGKTKKDFGHGEAEFVTYLNVFNNPIADVMLTENIEIDSKQNEVKFGDIFFTASSETPKEVGMSSIWLANKPNVYLNSFCFGYRSYKKADPYFLAYLLRAFDARKQLKLLAQGISRYNISKNKAMEIFISLPALEEQMIIGIFFKNLDNLITLHQRKLKKLENAKSAYLSKMFPKNGSKYPELRFEGFTDAWEQCKLGDITESFSGGTPTAGKGQYYNGDIPFIRSGEISSYNTQMFITKKGLNNSSAKMVGPGDILYALYGATSGEVAISKINGAINQAILAIRSIRNDDHYFISQWLRMQKEKIISTYLQGGQGNLSGGLVKNLLIILPADKREQKLISSFLSNLDNLITLHQRKLEKLEQTKKALLNEMFV